MTSGVLGSPAGVSVPETFPTFSPAEVELSMDSRSIDLGDNIGVGSLDENSSISGPTTNISPRGQDGMSFGGEPDITTRTSFSVDVPPFKSQLDSVNTFSQSDMGKVFNTSDNQAYTTPREMDGFTVGSDMGPSYGQGFPSTESVHSYSQVFSTGSGSVLTYSQPFVASSESYSGHTDVGSFAQTNISNMMELKAAASEKSNICAVSLSACVSSKFLKKTLFYKRAL